MKNKKCSQSCMVVCNTKPKNYSSLKVWKFNGCLLQTQVHCTTFSFQVFFFLFHHLCIQLVYWLRYMWWLKLNKKFFGSAAMHSRKLFHLFLVSKSNPFSREYRAAWLWLWSINFGYTKLGSFLPKREQVKKIYFVFFEIEECTPVSLCTDFLIDGRRSTIGGLPLQCTGWLEK